MEKAILLSLWLVSALALTAQQGSISGSITSGTQDAETAQLPGAPLEFARVRLSGTSLGAVTDSKGFYSIRNIPFGEYEVAVKLLGYAPVSRTISIRAQNPNPTLDITLEKAPTHLDEVVISGTMKEVSKLESPVPVEVYSFEFFQANPTPSIFESLQNVNGVRPQLNCNVCNTGDIHINGLEGPYTMVLIDGMPIVSGLATVYGLTGIPQSLIERVEVVKGPASNLYGSEAVGGLINVITKDPEHAPRFSAEVMGTSWAEINTDLGLKVNVGKNASTLIGLNYFNYQLPIDNNGDGFTDITLQDRLSLFNKWSFLRPENRAFSIAGRYNYENRWGGQMSWTPAFRGGDSIYGESIYTHRWELFGLYQLPFKERIDLQFSANGHRQNSVYGDMRYLADQYIGFGQLVWDKSLGERSNLLAGLALRYTYYDDNTPATAAFDTTGAPGNAPSEIWLPGVFVQNEIGLGNQHKLLLGLRYDYNSVHGSIVSPRFNYKWNSRDRQTALRASVGNGYRVANVFTEDHAALTGARQVVFAEELLPERSWNANINLTQQIITRNSIYIGLDASAFYTFFGNRILPDYDTDPNKIIYANLDGSAVSQGASLNLNVAFPNGLKVRAGATAMDVSIEEDGIRRRQILTEEFSGVWSVSYTFHRLGNLEVDYTGNVFGPMRLPLLSDTDPRPEYSPWFSIQNIKLSKKIGTTWTIYGGVKNLLNYTPPANSIARAFDPFDRGVTFDPNGDVVATPNNPNRLTFDPTYMFAPNQGIRGFLGVNFVLGNEK